MEGFFSSLTEDNLADGFANRLLVIRAQSVGKRNLDPDRMDIPEGLVKALQSAYEASKDGEGNMPRTAGTKPPLKRVPWADKMAQAAWLAIAEWEDAQLDRAPQRQGVIGRAAEQTIKLATIAALARAPDAPAVSVADVEWAWALVQASIGVIEHGVRENMAGSEFEALCKCIERAVVAAGHKGVAYSDLARVRGVSKADDRAIKAALERLKLIGVIAHDVGISSAGGRPQNRIRPLLN